MRVLQRRKTGERGDAGGRQAPRGRNRAIAHVHPLALALLAVRALGGVAGRWWRRILRDVLEPYRPELHYMRGPGPKWRQKHDGSPGH
jgi:hypothetical protein